MSMTNLPPLVPHCMAQVYDPSSGCWQSLPDMRQPRYAHAVASLAGRVYALGGQASKAIHRWGAVLGIAVLCADTRA
jgi:hypothetical protein